MLFILLVNLQRIENLDLSLDLVLTLIGDRYRLLSCLQHVRVLLDLVDAPLDRQLCIAGELRGVLDSTDGSLLAHGLHVLELSVLLLDLL